MTTNPQSVPRTANKNAQSCKQVCACVCVRACLGACARARTRALRPCRPVRCGLLMTMAGHDVSLMWAQETAERVQFFRRQLELKKEQNDFDGKLAQYKAQREKEKREALAEFEAFKAKAAENEGALTAAAEAKVAGMAKVSAQQSPPCVDPPRALPL